MGKEKVFSGITPEGCHLFLINLSSIQLWTLPWEGLIGRRKCKFYCLICTLKNKWKERVRKRGHERGAEVTRNTEIMDSLPEVTAMCYTEHKCRSGLSICWVFWKQCQYNYACGGRTDGAESNLTFSDWYLFIITQHNGLLRQCTQSSLLYGKPINPLWQVCFCFGFNAALLHYYLGNTKRINISLHTWTNKPWVRYSIYVNDVYSPLSVCLVVPR